MMRGSRIAVGLACVVLAAARVGASEPEPELKRLRAEVELLASLEYQGRRDEGGRKAAEHLVAEFRGLGLAPLFGGEYLQTIPGKAHEATLGRNVGARLEGSDPKLRDEWIIVSAHFDHLGMRGDVLYPGADDNASGVAMMLEVARCLVQGRDRPARSVMFLGFDLEEAGLYGSRYFAEHSPVPLQQIALFVTADMIGRSLGGVCGPYVFVMGSEHVPGVRPWIERAASGRPLRVGLLGSDLLVLDRSDYGPFRSRQVPFLFFTTGENPCYHTPQDTADSLDYHKLAAISGMILSVVRQAASAPSVPRWRASPEHVVAEAATVHDILRELLENGERLKIGGYKAVLMNNTMRRLEAIITRGTITPAERAGMVTIARLVLFSVL
jgi:hypothetical protein